MNQKLTFVALAMYAIAYAVLLFMWFYFVTNHVTGAEDFVGYIKLTLAGLTGHVLTILPGGASMVTTVDSVKAGQAGRASVRMIQALIAIAFGIAILGGCTTTTGSIVRGYEAQAKAGVQVFDDNQIMLLRDAWCLQPYGAIARHPEVQPAVSSLCGQLANATSIDPVQAQRFLDIARQLGVGVTSLPAIAPAAAASAPAK